MKGKKPCHHKKLRLYEFGCDGAIYLAIECCDCPGSTSLLIEDLRREINVDEFNHRFTSPGEK